MFQEYYERGLSAIPVKAGDKFPTMQQWQRYCETLPTQADVSTWDFRHKVPNNSNIGLCCGPASGVVALDIDTDDKAILDLCPPSPVRRRGKKGEVRFFKWREGITSHKIGGIIDVLSVGKQVVLPPSIHPEGMPYRWLTKDTLENMNPGDLPEIDFSFAEKVEKIAPEVMTRMGIKNNGEGRHDKLVKMIYAGVMNDQDKGELIDQVIAYDKENHIPPYFDDPENTRGTGRKAAEKLYQSVLKGAEKQGKTETIKDADRVIISIEPKSIKEQLKIKKDYKKLPKLPGLGDVLFQDIYKNSWVPRTQFSYMATLQILSHAIGTRISFSNTLCNLYQYGIAESGAGKESPLRKAQSYLVGLNRQLIATGSDITSGSIIHSYFQKFPERIFFVNEADKLLKRMANDQKNNGTKETLTEFYDAGKTLYGRDVLNGKGTGTDTYEDIKNFFIGVYLLSTPAGFNAVSTSDMFDSGLFSRFLFFIENRHKRAEFKKSVNEKADEDILFRLKVIHSHGQPECIVGHETNTFELQATPEADAYLEVLHNKIEDYKEFMKGKTTYGGIINRIMIHIKKLSILHHVMIHEVNYHRPLGVESLLWAEEAVMAIVHNMLKELESNIGGTVFDQDCAKILAKISKMPEGAKMRDLKNLRIKNKKDMKNYLAHLIDTEQVKKDKEQGRYHFLG
jgi:hypothetical protein